MRPLLELNNISYSYHTIDGETKALSDISFQRRAGRFLKCSSIQKGDHAEAYSLFWQIF